MTYTPTEWETGDTITAQKLNNIEDGIQEAAQSSGHDGEVLISDSGGDVTASIVSGTYEALSAIVESHNSPNVLFVYRETSGAFSWRTDSSAVTYYASNYTVPSITFSLYVRNPDGNMVQVYVLWDANDDVWWD